MRIPLFNAGASLIGGVAIVIAAVSLAGCGQNTAAAGAQPQPNGPAFTTPAIPALPVPAAPMPTSAPVAGTQVTIDNFTFTPGALAIKAGTTVTWTNHDDVPHTITAQDHAYSSAGLDTGDTFAHTFDAPGTYVYYCTIHPKMTATVIVR